MADNRVEVLRLLYWGDPLAVAANPVEVLRAPEAAATPLDWDRVEGMLLGLAIGDSLGNTSESMNPALRRARHGDIRDYLPNRHAGGRKVGLPSDDTQLTAWSLEHLVDEGGLSPPALPSYLCREPLFGSGTTVRAFKAAVARGEPWEKTGQASAGNGALMRIAPVILPHLRDPSSALWADAALAGMITHDDRASNAACVAFVQLLWRALHERGRPRAGYWLEPFVAAARAVEGDEPRYASRVPGADPAKVTLAGFTETEVGRALAQGSTARQACDGWYSGAYLLETVPSVLFILERFGHDPEAAIIRAVNDTRDNDTIAAIVGAAVGALHGKSGLPRRWLDGLIGRTGVDDDGRYQQLLARARRVFSPRAEEREAGPGVGRFALPDVLAVQAHFHDLIRHRAVDEGELPDPADKPRLTLLGRAQVPSYFPVPGMCGGFSYRWDDTAKEATLITESWCRVVDGSEERHVVTGAGWAEVPMEHFPVEVIWRKPPSEE